MALLLRPTRLAVSIEGHSIRLLSCQGSKVRWWADVALEPRLLRNGFLADARGFAQAINAAQVTKYMKGKAVAALPGFQSFFKVIQVPKEAEHNLGVFVTGEARRSIPDVDRNNFLFWQAFGPKDSARQSVFLLAVPRQPLITFVEALGAAGKRPKSLDLRPLALARAVNRENAIIGNAESMALDVIIVRDDVPVLMRSLFLGQDFEPVEYVSARLADELVRTISHFNITSQGGALAPDTPIYLTGSGASDPNLVSMVQDMTQHPVAHLEPPLEFPDDFPVDKFMVHVGLLLK